MQFKPFCSRVNVARLRPVVDPHCARRSDPDEQAPACPACRSATRTLWFVDRRTTAPVLVCLSCTPYQPTNEFPEPDVPSDRGIPDPEVFELLGRIAATRKRVAG